MQQNIPELITAINPYVAGDPVGGTSAFVGREEVLTSVLNILSGRDKAVVLHGQRRIGKTSVLLELQQRLKKQQYYPVYYDLQDKTTWSLDEVVTNLAYAIAQKLDRPEPDLGTDPNTAFQKIWLPELLASLPENGKVILLFDEFDVLDDDKLRIKPEGHKYYTEDRKLVRDTFFPYLRQLMDRYPQRLKFVFVIWRNIEDLTSLTLSLFKDVKIFRVSLLNRDNAQKLIRLSELDNTLKWQDEAVKRIWHYTHGHTFLTQQACSRVWDKLHENEADEIPVASLKDVEGAVAKMLEQSHSSLEWLWQGLPPAGQIVASVLASAGSKPISEDALIGLLQENGVRIVIRELQNAPRLLESWDLLEKIEDVGYRFQVELLRLWIAKNKPANQIQEEFDVINPAAQNLYQTAVGLYERGKFDSPVVLLRQAIQLIPNYTDAKQLLADIFLARSKTQESVVNILHLSDLHFSAGSDKPGNWYNQLADDLKHELECTQLDALILSGDIASSSIPEEYRKAEQFLRRLCEEFHLHREHIVIVPGNHDLNWELSKKAYELKRREEYQGAMDEKHVIDRGEYIEVKNEKNYLRRFRCFSDFYQAVKEKPYPADYAEQAMLHHFPKQNLLILGLNSAWQLDHYYTSRAGIHADALSNALTQIRQRPELYENCLKLAVWHHPISNACEDCITDTGFLERLAQAGFRIVLHGHIHKAETGLYRYDQSVSGHQLDIISAGAFGTPMHWPRKGYPLQYNFLNLTDDKLIVKTRCREEINGAWKPDARWMQGPGQDPISRYEISLSGSPGKTKKSDNRSDINPFFHGNSVLPEQLKGRDKELHLIVGRLLSQGQSTAITGSFRSGKTSILEYLAAPKKYTELYGDQAESFVFSYLDIAALSPQCSQAQFWEQALMRLQERVYNTDNLSSLSEAYQTCRENAFGIYVLEQLMARMKQAGWRTVLLLDDFDLLLHHPVLSCTEFFGGLRTLASRSKGALTLITTEHISLSQLHQNTSHFNRAGSPYFNFLDEVILGALPDVAINQLLYQDTKYFTDEDRRFLMEIAGGHPYLLQVAGAVLWNLYEYGDEINPDERCQHAELNFYQKARLMLDNTWHAWSETMHKVLTAVALVHMENPPSFTRDLSDFPQELDELEKHGFLVKDAHMPGGWRIRPAVLCRYIEDKLK